MKLVCGGGGNDDDDGSDAVEGFCRHHDTSWGSFSIVSFRAKKFFFVLLLPLGGVFVIFLIGNYQGSALKTTVSRSCDASLPKLNVPHESFAKNAHFPLKRTSVACNNNHFFVFKMFPEFILEKSSNCRFVVSS